MDHRPAAGQSIVKLNVGGHIHCTTLDTLCRDKDSMLSAMFSGRYNDFVHGERDGGGGEPGTVFIDRDGTRFRHVLNYLRNGRLHIPDDPILYGELLEEAEYFGLEGMRALLMEGLQYMDEQEEEEREQAEAQRAAQVTWDAKEVAV
mmetsp:Transcript_47976/g.153738  ORF Transcript_47976/g.153738 Transcript_47976/m.153738 type:complete len:147 (-) Transcript_47976:43-483(-)